MNRIFRRASALVLSILWVFTAPLALNSQVGCARHPRSEELFYYRTENVEAEISLEYNGVSSQFRYKGDENGCRVEFSQPDQLSGFVIEVTNGIGKITFGDLSAAAPDALCAIPNIMHRVFTLSAEEITDVETEQTEGAESETTTKIVTSDITVKLNSQGIPICAEGAKFKAEIRDFTVNPRN